jgi:hypothetical protein
MRRFISWVNLKKSKSWKTWIESLGLFFPAVVLQRMRKIIAGKKGLLAVKMRSG